MELSEYNGWENKFTWLVHLHLSNEQALAQEMAALVGSVSSNRAAGRLLKTWVKASLFNWLAVASSRAYWFDAAFQLLGWDLAGAVLAYTDWDIVVKLLAGRVKKSHDLFALTMVRFIQSDKQLQAFIQEMVQAFPNTFMCADTMHMWFREQVDLLFDGHEAIPQSGMAALVHELLEVTYRVIVWEHGARAFRPEY